MTGSKKKRRLSPNRAALTPKKLAVEETRAEIARLYSEGLTMREIANQVGLTRQGVGYNLRIIHQRTLEQGTFSFKEALARALTELEGVAQAAWEGWERSIGTVTETYEAVDSKTGEIRQLKRTKPQAGDPRMLEQYQRAIERRAVLLGLWNKGPDTQVNVQINQQEKQDVRLEIAQMLRKQIERLQKGEALLADIRAAQGAEAGFTEGRQPVEPAGSDSEDGGEQRSAQKGVIQ